MLIMKGTWKRQKKEMVIATTGLLCTIKSEIHREGIVTSVPCLIAINPTINMVMKDAVDGHTHETNNILSLRAKDA